MKFACILIFINENRAALFIFLQRSFQRKKKKDKVGVRENLFCAILTYKPPALCIHTYIYIYVYHRSILITDVRNLLVHSFSKQKIEQLTSIFYKVTGFQRKKCQNESLNQFFDKSNEKSRESPSVMLQQLCCQISCTNNEKQS